MRQPHGAMALAADVDVGLRAKAHTRYVRLDEGSGYGAIASGSFGRVYAAVDSKTQATVKVKRQELPSMSAQRELFLQGCEPRETRQCHAALGSLHCDGWEPQVSVHGVRVHGHDIVAILAASSAARLACAVSCLHRAGCVRRGSSA